MASVNKVILVGHLGADPEVRSFQSGGKICNFRIATGESWKDRNTGERQERTEWHTVAIFSEGLVGVAERYLRKGSKVYIEGQLRTRKWQAQDGTDRYSTEVVLQGPQSQLVMLDSAGGGQNGDSRGDRDQGQRQQGGRQSNQRGGQSGGWGGQSSGGNGGGWSQSGGSSFADDLDDDIPF